jgi:hypothetical protein
VVKTVLKYVACVAIPAVVIAAVVAVLITHSIYDRQRLSSYGHHIFLSMLPSAFARTLTSYTVTTMLVLALAQLMRLVRWPRIGCFAAAWILMTVAQTTFIVLTVPAELRDHISWLTVMPASAAVVAILTVAVALCHFWLIGRRPKADAAAVF